MATPSTPITPLEGEVEMFSRGRTQPLFTVDTVLANRTSKLSMVEEVDTPSTWLEIPASASVVGKLRPTSDITEMWDEELEAEAGADGFSVFEEEEVDAFDGFGLQMNESRRSQSTISTIDEIPTPHSLRRLTFIDSPIASGLRRSVEGPRGPHLFRHSDSELDPELTLQLSPLLPKRQELKVQTAFPSPVANHTPTTITDAPAAFTTSRDHWNKDEPSSWTAEQVSLWMSQTGVDSAVVETFEANDISGRVLLDLQFDDLRDIGIESFGKRYDIWERICTLRDGNNGVSPMPTEFLDLSPCSEETEQQSRRHSETSAPRPRRRRKRPANPNDPITPMDSVSIVAIEQLIPKPHKCSKGEKCPKWKQQQKLMKCLHDEHGFPISPGTGGQIFITGNPGNASTAPNIMQCTNRPASEAVPSVAVPSLVASSDILGPSDMPRFALERDALERLEQTDAQDAVKKFLALQQGEASQNMANVTSLYAEVEQELPYEVFPQQHSAPVTTSSLLGLQRLPRLHIPRTNTAPPASYWTGGGLSAIQDPFSAVGSPDGGLYRFGTPATDMDVPMTYIPMGPVARDASQSVPPNMHFYDSAARRSSRQGWHRPSYTLPRVNEHEVFSPSSSDKGPRRGSAQTFGSYDLREVREEVRLSPLDREKDLDPRYPGVNHAGWMKKRKTKMLRHEWNEHHFRLRGNKLVMHQNDIPQSTRLESLNIDDYAIACSSIASNKLAARFRALKLASDRKKDSAFEFQLVPEQILKGKAHHFAVKTRDERMDWMRELMLAKALKAKENGLAVEVNGRAI